MADAPLLGADSDEPQMSPMDWRFNSVHADTWDNVLLTDFERPIQTIESSSFNYDAAAAAATALPTDPPPLLSQDEMGIRDKLRAGFGCLKLKLDYDSALNVLKLHVFEARDLRVADMNGSSDPYVKAKFIPVNPEQATKQKTEIKRHMLNPVWNEVLQWEMDELHDHLGQPYGQGSHLQVDIWDWDRLSRNDFLGRVLLPLNEVLPHPNHYDDYALSHDGEARWYKLHSEDTPIVAVPRRESQLVPQALKPVMRALKDYRPGPTQSRGSTATAGAGSGGAAAASGGALKDKNGPAASGGGSGSGSGSSTAASGGGLSKLLCGIVSCISDPWRSGLLIREGDVLEVLDTGPENAGTGKSDWTLVQNLMTTNIGWAPTNLLSQAEATHL